MNTTSVDSAVDDGRVTTDIRDHVQMIGIGQPAKRNGFTPVMLRALARAGETPGGGGQGRHLYAGH